MGKSLSSARCEGDATIKFIDLLMSRHHPWPVSHLAPFQATSDGLSAEQTPGTETSVCRLLLELRKVLQNEDPTP